jgi:hypothetical protein
MNWESAIPRAARLAAMAAVLSFGEAHAATPTSRSSPELMQ